MEENSQDQKKKLAIRGALILGGTIVGAIALNVILEISKLNGIVNGLEDKVVELIEASNQNLSDIRILKGVPIEGLDT